MPLSRIFIINPKGELRRASSTMQSSTWSSLSAINDLVHQVFAPLQLQQQQEGGGRGGVAQQQDEKFNDMQVGRGSGAGGGASSPGGGGSIISRTASGELDVPMGSVKDGTGKIGELVCT